jgi:Leucine-rich repeat (LRR) protein
MLDISNNHFTELWSLIPFTKLKILIADHNALPSSVQLPSLPSLETLWVNYNRITNLSLFMTHLAAKAPGLRHLSLLGNDADRHTSMMARWSSTRTTGWPFMVGD